MWEEINYNGHPPLFSSQSNCIQELHPNLYFLEIRVWLWASHVTYWPFLDVAGQALCAASKDGGLGGPGWVWVLTGLSWPYHSETESLQTFGIAASTKCSTKGKHETLKQNCSLCHYDTFVPFVFLGLITHLPPLHLLSKCVTDVVKLLLL